MYVLLEHSRSHHLARGKEIGFVTYIILHHFVKMFWMDLLHVLKYRDAKSSYIISSYIFLYYFKKILIWMKILLIKLILNKH